MTEATATRTDTSPGSKYSSCRQCTCTGAGSGKLCQLVISFA